MLVLGLMLFQAMGKWAPVVVHVKKCTMSSLLVREVRFWPVPLADGECRALALLGRSGGELGLAWQDGVC